MTGWSIRFRMSLELSFADMQIPSTPQHIAMRSNRKGDRAGPFRPRRVKHIAPARLGCRTTPRAIAFSAATADARAPIGNYTYMNTAAQTLASYFDSETAKVLSACTACGKCVEVCLVVP